MFSSGQDRCPGLQAKQEQNKQNEQRNPHTGGTRHRKTSNGMKIGAEIDFTLRRAARALLLCGFRTVRNSVIAAAAPKGGTGKALLGAPEGAALIRTSTTHQAVNRPGRPRPFPTGEGRIREPGRESLRNR